MYEIGQKFIDGFPNDLGEWCKKNNAHLVQNGVTFTILAIPAPALAELKKAKLKEVDSWTERKITGGFVSSCTGAPIRYDSDKDTQLTMQGIALNVHTNRFAVEYPNGCPVRGVAKGAESKSVYWLTPEQVMQWMADLSMHIGSCKQAGWAKQAEVDACKSVDEVNAITLGGDESVPS